MSEARTVFEDVVPAALAAHPELSGQVNAMLHVEIGGDGGGAWAIDLRREHAPRVLAGEHPAATCRIRIAHDDFAALMDGRQRWTDAFVHGRIEVTGDLVTALKLRKLFAAYGG